MTSDTPGLLGPAVRASKEQAVKKFIPADLDSCFSRGDDKNSVGSHLAVRTWNERLQRVSDEHVI